MERVRFLTIAAGPDLSAQPGQILDVEETQARDLVKGGYAERVKAEAETADAPASGQTAATPANAERREAQQATSGE